MTDKTYRIKPLEWVETQPGSGWWIAKTIFCPLHVETDTEAGEDYFTWRYCVDEYYDEGQFDCESIEDGKAKAEAWFLERILPALEEVQQ